MDTHSTTQKGGRLIGEGVYGAVFNPPLKFRNQLLNKTDKVAKLVGKITSPYDAQQEMKASVILNQGPLPSNYFVLATKSGQPAPRSEQTEPDLNKAGFLADKRLPSQIQLQMPWGGKPLSVIDLKSLNLFNFTTHLLEAGALMLLRGICHGDLHSGNILVDSFNVPRIIDFGMSFVGPSLSREEVIFIIKQPIFSYSQEPPEMSLLNQIANSAPDTIPEDTIYNIITDKPIFKQMAAMFQVQPKDYISALQQCQEESISIHNKDYRRFLKTWWPQWDSWSIGVIMLSLYTIVPQDRQDKRVFEICRYLLSPSPSNRPDAIEALAQFKPDSYVLKTYCMDWLAKRQAQQNNLDVDTKN